VLKVDVLGHQAGRLKLANPAVHGFMDEVVGHAPDASAAQAAEPKSAKVMINLQTPADLLAKVDGAASALSLTRFGYIKLVLTRAVQAENN
jgi:hypothetical protein